MKMYAFHCGGERAPMSVFDPLDPDCGKIILPPYFFYLIDHPDGKALFDTGAHPALRTDPRSRLGEAADLYDLTLEPGDDVVSQLDRLGVPPEDIKHVVQSHLHFDHCGGLEFVKDATIYVQRGELQFAHWPPVYQRGLFVRADFDNITSWKELDGEYDVFNDGKVIVFPTPGHTPGHQSLLVRLDSRARILVGDAAYDRGKMRDRCIPGILWNPDAIVASWERIEEYQRRYDAELIFSHDLHYKENIKVAPEDWYE